MSNNAIDLLSQNVDNFLLNAYGKRCGFIVIVSAESQTVAADEDGRFFDLEFATNADSGDVAASLRMIADRLDAGEADEFPSQIM